MVSWASSVDTTPHSSPASCKDGPAHGHPALEDWQCQEPKKEQSARPLVSTESFISLQFYPNQSFKNQIAQT